MNAPRVMRCVWLLAGFSLLLSVLRDPVFRALNAPPRHRLPATWFEGGFRSGGVYPATAMTNLPAGSRAIGSWQEGDQWQGEAATAWLAVTSRVVRVHVAGYPGHPGCALFAEVRDAGGAITRIDYRLSDPRESWQAWDIPLSARAIALRVRAEDRATDAGGWLAFSEPLERKSDAPANAFMLAQALSTVALVLALLWGPGLLWAPGRSSPDLRAVVLVGAGPLCLVIAALAIWLLDGAFRPHRLAFVLVTAGWVTLGVRLHRRPPGLGAGEAGVLAVASLIVAAATLKATYGGGPEGELYGGTISRTLAVGDRSDARISFHVVQTVARHAVPWSPAAEWYFQPWTFFSRGPLAGLAAAPIALAAGGRPPADMPDLAWQPFDSTGFAAYRIVLAGLASMVIFALFAALAATVGERWALIGAGLLALSPFGVHEILFTWPKWEATAWTILSFLLAHRRRPLAAGLALGVGFLFHPLAALWAPWLALWAAGRAEKRFGPFLAAGLRFAASLALIVVVWMAIGAGAPHTAAASNAGQSGFFNYFTMADGGPASGSSWWHSRWLNFSNTFLPFWLYTFHSGHPNLSSVYAPSGPLVRFAFGWWSTLPLGLGLGLWGVTVLALSRAARSLPAAFWLLIAGPALLLIAYWGAYATGLLRECGHPLFAAIVGIACVTAARTGGIAAQILAHPAVPWLQLPETLAMLWLTTLLNPHPWPAADPGLNTVCLVFNLLALGGAAWLLARARHRLA